MPYLTETLSHINANALLEVSNFLIIQLAINFFQLYLPCYQTILILYKWKSKVPLKTI